MLPCSLRTVGRIIAEYPYLFKMFLFLVWKQKLSYLPKKKPTEEKEADSCCGDSLVSQAFASCRKWPFSDGEVPAAVLPSPSAQGSQFYPRPPSQEREEAAKRSRLFVPEILFIFSQP